MSVVPAPQPDGFSPKDRPRLQLCLRTMGFFGLVMLMFTSLLVFIAEGLLRGRLTKSGGAHFEYLAFAISRGVDGALDEFRRQLNVTAAAPFLYSANSAAPNTQAQRIALKALKDSNPDFAWIAYVDPDGNVVAATDGVMEGTSVVPRPWFGDLKDIAFSARVEKWQALDNAMEKPDRPEELGRRVFLAVRLPGATVGLGGALVAQLGWDWARAAQNSVLPEEARDVQLGATIYASPSEVIADSGGSGWTRPPGAPDVPLQRAARGVKLEKAAGGGEYLTGYARCAKYPYLNWVVTVRQSTKYAFASVAQLRESAVPWALLLTFLSLCVSGLFAYRITRRMHSVKLAAQRIQSGDVLTSMPIGRDDSEVEEMCDAVNRLIDHLQKAARTAESKPTNSR
ncbi:MAG: cache and HAMP domain-containing protein [Opitutaceae bacterium]